VELALFGEEVKENDNSNGTNPKILNNLFIKIPTHYQSRTSSGTSPPSKVSDVLMISSQFNSTTSETGFSYKCFINHLYDVVTLLYIEW
jgi:hypothetical protein